MRFPTEFFSTPTGQLALVGALAAFAAGAVYWQRRHQPAAMPRPVAPASAPSTPKTFTREGARFVPPRDEAPVVTGPAVTVGKNPTMPATAKAPVVLPISLTPVRADDTPKPVRFAPYGRLIPCETVLTIESNRLDTPVIGLVKEAVWHDGRLIVPVGAEVHGRASTDRARERLAAQGTWRIVWRSPGADHGDELAVQGLALNRERDSVTGTWGLHDGSAGLRGDVLRTNDWHEVQLFAAAFLSTATAALQDTRTTATLLGETLTPTTTTRNAALAGTGAVLREYANQIRQSIDRDGVYVRVPAGKAFYLYVTETLDLGRARHGAASLSTHAP
ncbi:MAG: TrbI/VirB10 family protein [Acidobacteria bacterium]|nr:TrbI/VirB10 family protein [Acidobacteriota bacterium]